MTLREAFDAHQAALAHEEALAEVTKAARERVRRTHEALAVALTEAAALVDWEGVVDLREVMSCLGKNPDPAMYSPILQSLQRPESISTKILSGGLDVIIVAVKQLAKSAILSVQSLVAAWSGLRRTLKSSEPLAGLPVNETADLLGNKSGASTPVAINSQEQCTQPIPSTLNAKSESPSTAVGRLYEWPSSEKRWQHSQKKGYRRGK